MTCNHCKANVENSITGLDGIESAEANLSTGKVSIQGAIIDLEKIRDSVESLGYSLEEKSD